MKNTISKTFTAITLTAALLTSASATAFAAEDSATSDETVNPGNYEYTITDATNVQKSLAGVDTLTDEQEYLYDIDGAEGISIIDATVIQKVVAGINNQPTYHEDAETAEVGHPAEYETVTTQEWVVDQEETTKEVPTYIYSYRMICGGFNSDYSGIYESCGNDITQYDNRYDEAVANGEIVPGDGNYEKLTNVNGHWYNFTEEPIRTLVLAAGESGYYNGIWITAKKDIYTGISSDTAPCHAQQKTAQSKRGDTVEYSHDGWATGYGWYTFNMPDGITLHDYGTDSTVEISYDDTVIPDLENNIYDIMDIFEATETTKLSDDEIDKMHEMIDSGQARLQTIIRDYKGTSTDIIKVVYTTVTVPEQGHYEEVTEEVLVKEAYTETVTVPGGRWYCD